MDKIKIIGGNALNGTIPISGAKNAALPLIAAGLLTADELALENVPCLKDVETMVTLLRQHGTLVNEAWDESRLTFQSDRVTNYTAPYELVKTMRASVLVLGPLLARFGQAKVSLPGGCAIGSRPVDLHLKAMEALGATIELEGGYVLASAPEGLKGAEIAFEMVSVGATENTLMAAVLAEGQTTIRNAAREPEVTDLANCLVAMGAQIEGIGTSTLTITGVETLHGTTHRVVGDRIEAGSFACAAAMTGGHVTLTGIEPRILKAVLDKLTEAGVQIETTDDTITIKGANLRGVDIMTQVYPGFPTDMQAQMMALMTRAEGASMMTETIFENRFMHVPELARMGANITAQGRSAIIRGSEKLTGAEVMATDLRASLSLVIAALAAEGETTISRIYHLDRGYEKLEEKLSAVGATIERVS